ncbi:MAG: hypothetical protein JST67_03725 [Bacteroidetes bacterium]|nr:hypothetical protein [Bacteroidota bacterium]
MSFFKNIIVLFLVLFFTSYKSQAYEKKEWAPPSDSTEKAQKKQINRLANRMMLYSAVLPGLGQVCNKKYWKVPIIYAGLGALGYFIGTNYANVQSCHKELLYRYSNINNINTNSYQNPKYKGYSANDVNTLKQDAKRNMDFCIIGAGLIYLFNVIDANVDGHFRTFDMSDKLSLSLKPQSSFCLQNPAGFTMGVSLSLTFKK